MAVLGVDGRRGRWVGARLTGRTVELLALDDMAAVLAVPDVELITIDMPIGLSDDGVRACDVAAKKALGPAGSSVFPTPIRAVLQAADYAEAREISRARTTPPRAPSAQAFQLVKAIRRLDEALGDPPSERVVEVHPELAFRAIAPGTIGDPKITARGAMQRLEALRRVMDVEHALASAPRLVPMVDALDACAAAWSAARLARDGGDCVGDGSLDSRGRPMRICW